MRRLRATFLLRIAIFAGVLCGFGLAPLGALLIGALAVEPCELAVEHGLVARAARRPGSGSTPWFVDLDEESRDRIQRHLDDTEGHPTLR